jgi:hypothetical protein
MARSPNSSGWLEIYCIWWGAQYIKLFGIPWLNCESSGYRPDVAQRVPGGLSSKIFMTFGTWRWRGHQPHAPVAFTPRNFLVLIFTKAMVRSEGDMSLKNPVTPRGIDPGTLWLNRYLNKLTYGTCQNARYLNRAITSCFIHVRRSRDGRRWIYIVY